MDYQSAQGVIFSPGTNFPDVVKIILPRIGKNERSLEVPIDSLLEYVADYVQRKRIAALEQVTVEQILGIEESK